MDTLQRRSIRPFIRYLAKVIVDEKNVLRLRFFASLDTVQSGGRREFCAVCSRRTLRSGLVQEIYFIVNVMTLVSEAAMALLPVTSFVFGR